MARISFLVSALTAGIVFAASPLASATSPDQTPAQPSQVQPTQVQQTASEPVAQGANMLPMAMCGDRANIVADLEQHYSEEPMAVGQVDGNAVVEILVSDSGSWTILATGTDGVSCIVSAGEGFESTSLVRGVDA
jgi:hypothetical protein